jgi:hypothetical protein
MEDKKRVLKLCDQDVEFLCYKNGGQDFFFKKKKVTCCATHECNKNIGRTGESQLNSSSGFSNLLFIRPSLILGFNFINYYLAKRLF